MTRKKKLWQMCQAEFVDYSRTLPTPNFTPVFPKDFSEEEMHRVSMLNRLHEKTPPTIEQFPAGTWALQRPSYDGDLHSLWELREIPICRLHRVEGQQPLAIVEKYANWYDAGSPFPPIRVIETVKGTLVVIDGHHRLDAMGIVEQTTVLAWVSPNFGKGSALSHEAVICEAIAAGEHVPDSVLNDYPKIRDQTVQLRG